MSMGNFLPAERVRLYTMATSDTALDEGPDVEFPADSRRFEGGIGIDHLTVVPENFDPETDAVDR